MKVTSVLFLVLPAVHAWQWGLTSSNSGWNSWNENQLTRWLEDHNIPYPQQSNKKDLQSRVSDAWEKVKINSPPYEKWDEKQLKKWLRERQIEIEDTSNVGSLKDRVWSEWYHEKSAWENAKEWVFDTWTDSQLKSFLDHHGITHPEPTTRAKILTQIRQSHDNIANKAKGTADDTYAWVFESWSDSDLKKWADQRGIPVPQGSKRNDLIAIVRRNSYSAHLKAKNTLGDIQDSLFDSYSDSSLKNLADQYGINVPQGSKRNEVLAVLRRNSHLLGKEISSLQASASEAAYAGSASLTSAFGAATSAASNKWYEAQDSAFDAWSESRLKQFLDARGIPAPQPSTKDDLVRLARLYKTKAQQKTVGGPATFDTWSSEQVTKWLEAQGHKVSTKEKENREALIKNAEKAYASASSAGGDTYASATSAFSKETGYLFDSWSDSDLKAFLDSYGVPVPQGSKKNELVAAARRNSHYFIHGNDYYGTGLVNHIQQVFWETYSKLTGNLAEAGKIVDSKAKTQSSTASNKASEYAASASSKAHHEL